jgi:hypothetical protein
MFSVGVESGFVRVVNREIQVVSDVTLHWPEASNDNVFYFHVLAQKLINFEE